MRASAQLSVPQRSRCSRRSPGPSSAQLDLTVDHVGIAIGDVRA
jgi:hypothetical protein